MNLIMSTETSFHNRYTPEPNSGCWLWTSSFHQDGYGIMRDNGRMRLAHRISWELHNGAIPHGMCVCHKCDVRCCVNPDHMFLGSLRDNAIDMARKGRVGNQKICVGDISNIRGMTTTEASKHFGISLAQASRIRNRTRFSHVQ